MQKSLFCQNKVAVKVVRNTSLTFMYEPDFLEQLFHYLYSTLNAQQQQKTFPVFSFWNSSGCKTCSFEFLTAVRIHPNGSVQSSPAPLLESRIPPQPLTCFCNWQHCQVSFVLIKHSSDAFAFSSPNFSILRFKLLAKFFAVIRFRTSAFGWERVFHFCDAKVNCCFFFYLVYFIYLHPSLNLSLLPTNSTKVHQIISLPLQDL